MEQHLSTLFQGIIALGVVLGGLKLWGRLGRFWVILAEHAPHTHAEKHESQPLTTDGILYARGTERRGAA